MSPKLLFLTICIYGTIQFAEQAGQVHGKLTDSQIKRIFHRNEAPNYQTIMVESADVHRSKRELRPLEFVVDGKKIQLNLTPIQHGVLSSYIPVWTVETSQQKPLGHAYQRTNPEETKIDGIFYQDLNKMATMLAYYKDRHIYYDGIFGESQMAKVVRSVPEKWWKIPGKEDLGNDHVIFDVNQDKGTTNPIEDRDEPKEKLDKPLDVMYPKLLVIVAHDYFKKFDEDISETIKYVATFWNAVNLEYSKLTSPKVKIVVTGVIIAKDDTALKYHYDSRNKTDMTKLNTLELLNKGGIYFRDDFGNEVDFKNYDSTITMTDLDTGIVAGSAYMGAICSETKNVGFVRDDGSFSGLQSATHELGHLLSLPHDGDGRANTCDSYPEDNVSTIMAPFVVQAEKFIWSECSKKILQKFASSKRSECMRHPSRSR